MASKRTINRAYWVAVKATAYDDTVSHGSDAQATYRLCLKGRPDSHVRPMVERLEERYGSRHIYADTSNPQLWEAREIIDSIRREETA